MPLTVGRPLRVAMLAKGWTGYLDAAFRALGDRGVELLVVRPRLMDDTDFRFSTTTGYAKVVEYAAAPDARLLQQEVAAFAPDAVLVHSWEVDAYRQVLRSLPPDVLKVLWMDNIWRGTARQWLGRVTARRYLHPLFDVAMVPSDRSEFFARRLGYGPDRVIRGCTPADTTTFATGPRAGSELGSRRAFLTAMRLVHHKGPDVLAEAYRIYRDLVPDPWELRIAGIGPMEEVFRGVPGVRLLGFTQPEELAEAMREASCFINPSRMEPYAVVLQEAAASGLPIICTDFVGAAPTMVQDGYNGWVVPGADPSALAQAMSRMSGSDAQRLEEMSTVSRAFGGRLSPEGWARNLEEEITRRLPVMR